ncbi:hypothetical protein BB558_000233 [Smittium angustum]|uniref:Uncharacterized protein n=1 Tax=Smittium angustum TaxID=133377 RepID=A0A2U1JES2_SMIAN|nr:hypothetical protein BB558_000233 [Smittium angustum]
MQNQRVVFGYKNKPNNSNKSILENKYLKSSENQDTQILAKVRNLYQKSRRKLIRTKSYKESKMINKYSKNTRHSCDEVLEDGYCTIPKPDCDSETTRKSLDTVDCDKILQQEANYNRYRNRVLKKCNKNKTVEKQNDENTMSFFVIFTACKSPQVDDLFYDDKKPIFEPLPLRLLINENI